MFKEAVELSGGDLGGQLVEGDGWKIGEDKQIDAEHIYRKLHNMDEKGCGVAIFVGYVTE